MAGVVGIPFDLARLAPIRRWIARRSRALRLKKVQRFVEVMRPAHGAVVLDVGFAQEDDVAGYRGDRSETLNPLARFGGEELRIVGLSFDAVGEAARRYPRVQLVRGDGRALPFKAQAVDYVFSNAVVEHVGTREKQRQFVRECMTVARKGVFITAPNYFFPLDPHFSIPFIQFLPRPVFRRLARLTGHATYSTAEGLNPLTAGSLRKCFPETARVHVEGVGLPLLPETLVAWAVQPAPLGEARPTQTEPRTQSGAPLLRLGYTGDDVAR
jgi:hypothetical protein